MLRRAKSLRRVLVAVDFSAPSLRAVDYAARLAGTRHAELILLHVIEPVFYGVAKEMYGVGSDAGDIYSDIERAARARLATIAALVRTHGVAVRPLIAKGTAYEQIVEHGSKLRADVIVLSTHGCGGLSHALIGSVADRVVRTAPMPVLTVPMRRSAAARRKSAAAPTPQTRRGAPTPRRRRSRERRS